MAHAEEVEGTCAAATETTVECMSFEISEEIEPFGGSGEKGGFSPSDLRSAYKFPATGGSGQTVAIVDAFNDPNAESDLKTYRSHYGLSECTKANGCFKKVNQAGEEASYPANNAGWSVEMSLDLDMVSAVCPECHIVLVEATSNSFANMDAAENKAAALAGTTVISDSWGAPETSNRTSEDTYFNHPGIPIMVSSGDYCYNNECRGAKAPNWPSTSKYVVSVGGTKLESAANSRGWKESVWYEAARAIGGGSGCSVYETKPSWQTDAGCSNRTDADVSAVGACESPVSVYDSYEREGWLNVCGTSASAPILAGIEGLSSKSVREMGAEAFWKAGPSGHLFDVTEGSNGSCGSSYLCTAKVGFDGPTGWGTPNGVVEVTGPPSATTEAATGLTKTEATLNGTVNPNGIETKYWFEYGTTTAYGTKTAEVTVGSGTSGLKESKAISGLSLNTTYHFRIVATNSAGTTNGLDKSFKTLPNPPENTAVPVVSPTTPLQAVPESTTTGTWTNEPTSYAYQWQRCNAAGAECVNISGATKSTYTPVEADVAHTLVAKVTASNAGGSNSAVTAATAKVKPVGEITQYAVPHEGTAQRITSGSDGNLWLQPDVSSEHNGRIDKVTIGGVFTEFLLPKSRQVHGMTAGPDGNVWFAFVNSLESLFGGCGIGKITPSGVITEYSLPSSSDPEEIVAGPDGNLWFTEYLSQKIGKITTSGTKTEYSLPAGSTPKGIAVGPDGNLWFANGLKVGKITTSGTITEYSASTKSVGQIATGPDNNLWFTVEGGPTVAKMTTSGTVTEYALPENSRPHDITAGPDGNLWFTNWGTGKVGRITTSGTITEYSVGSESRADGITVGPDQYIWFTTWGIKKIGKITP